MPKTTAKNVTEYTDGPPDLTFSQMKGLTIDPWERVRGATISVVRRMPITCLHFSWGINILFGMHQVPSAFSNRGDDASVVAWPARMEAILQIFKNHKSFPKRTNAKNICK